MDEITNAWITDTAGVARVLRQWPRPELGWAPDGTLFDNTPDAARIRRELLSNPQYANIGGVVELPEEAVTALQKLNCPSDVPLVPEVVLSEIHGSIAKGRECVVVTFSLYLLFEKLPSLSDYALKQAEVDSFILSLKQKASMPPAVTKALNDACTPPKSG